MQILLVIAALCQLNGGGTLDYVRTQQSECQKYYLSCYDRAAKDAKFETSKWFLSFPSNTERLAECIRKRK